MDQAYYDNEDRWNQMERVFEEDLRDSVQDDMKCMIHLERIEKGNHRAAG